MFKKISLLAVIAFAFGGFFVWEGYVTKFLGGDVFAEDDLSGVSFTMPDVVKEIEKPKRESIQLDTRVQTRTQTRDVEQKKVEVTTKSKDTTKVEYYAQPKQEIDVPSVKKPVELPKPLVVSKPRETKPVETKPTETPKPVSQQGIDNTSTNSYLGTAESSKPGEFNLTIDTEKQLPNGQYQIVPKLYQKDGTTAKGGKTLITVNNPQVRTLSPEEKTKFANSDVDTDGDDIPDKEEIRLSTNPLLADTDGDGFLDEDEIKNGFDPLKFSPGDKSDKIVFESPKTVAPSSDTTTQAPEEKKKSKTTDSRFTVNAVTVADVVASGDVHKKVARFSGKALPNIFVTVYIYSDPIIVTVKTDANGNWSYDLDKELPDGNHEVYVAVTDNVGKITAQSQALPFIKTADAIAVQPAVASATEIKNNSTPLEKSQTEFVIIALIITASFIGIALVLIGRRATLIK